MMHLISKPLILGVTLFIVCGDRIACAEEFAPKSMGYVLQPEKLAKGRAAVIDKLAGCKRDLIVIDYAFDGSAEGKWTAAQIAKIRAGKPGRRVVAYLSIGEAEDYRWYWKPKWDKNKDGKPDEGAPSFLNAVNPDWEGNYKVRYWDKQWQAIILDYIDQIQAQGFDGVYMDIIDAFEFYEYDAKKDDWIDNRPNLLTGNTYRQDMIKWVGRIAANTRKTKPGFLIIPQNGSQLLSDPGYVKTIDAIGIEDLFTNGKKIYKTKQINERLNNFAPLKATGKTVLVIEYPKKQAMREAAIKLAKKNDVVLLLTDRALKTLGQADEN
jgi:cysteinyl-tRNA synthetase